MSRAPWRGWGVALRLSVALSAVTLVTVATAGLVASLIGPGIFHENLLQHNEDASDDATEHAEAAFGTAGSVSLGAALLLALLVSSVLSIWIAGRVTRSLQPIVAAAGSVARGVYDRRVPVPGLGAEFDDVATAMNAMSERPRARRRHPPPAAGRPGPRDAHAAGHPDRVCRLDRGRASGP
ncbi:HAMP domain-containing protein [Cellulomonas sp. Y8]|uniref:HAMP domain-containing protein n=1 Tax=Cellulomonas sp. Y8 TaxID=2591145 RepID=UPI001FED4F60|nr:HAMP domain-containing protein [Cellulomonas sp. Y8]